MTNTIQTTSMMLNKMSYQVNERKKNIDNITNLASSGKKINTIEELVKVGGVNKHSELIQEISITDLCISKNINLLNNMKVADGQMEIMHDDITQAISDMAIYQGNINHPYTDTLKGLIKEHLKVIEDALNHSVAGNYIFSGYNSNKPPVGNLVDKSNLLDGMPTANYINDLEGGQENIQESISNNKSARVNIIASDKVFVNIIGTYHKILDKLSKGDNIFQESNELSEQQENLRQLRGKLASNSKVIEDTNTSLENNKESIEKVFSELISLDISEMAEKFTELSQEEEHLKMIFSMMSVMQNISILDYLK